MELSDLYSNYSPKHFYAHKKSLQDGRFELQTVLAHLEGVAELAAQFAAPFGGEKIARFTGASHDIGKYTTGFQKRLLTDGPKVDHSTAGALECAKAYNLAAAMCVIGHHAGLPDIGFRGDLSGSSTFWGRINQGKKLEDYNAFRQELQPKNALAPAFANSSPLAAAFFIRMMYSCLVDADFLDTEAFVLSPRQRNDVSLATLLDTLNAHVAKWFPPKSELNRLRCRILESCIHAGQAEEPGLFTLTVPTGGGKTIASLAFALNHAVHHSKKRVIYVIPYTSIIDQTAAVFSDILGEENVLAHHSGVQYELDDMDSELSLKKAQATENWDEPIIVTTAVQFFESLFSNRSSKCRKLHNLADSVIIFDEAQVLPVSYIRPSVYAISQLVQNYGATAVLCTATQPALGPIFAEFLPNIPIREICPSEYTASPIFQRVLYQYAGIRSWDSLCDLLNSKHQVLCIVNTRKSATKVFKGLSGDGCFHLSTLMFPAHRKAQLAQIRERLSSDLPCKVVSTSLIEAGVDVDFPVVFREKTGLDSMVQAAGRCNREGKRSLEESVVTIFDSESAPPPMISENIAAAEYTMQKNSDFSCDRAIREYYTELLDLKGKHAQDKEEILPLIEESKFPFQSIAERFKFIDSDTRTVYIPMDGGAEWVSKLRKGDHSPQVYRKLNQFAVNIYPQHFQALTQANDLEMVSPDTAILTNLGLYSNNTGLSLEADNGKGLFV